MLFQEIEVVQQAPPEVSQTFLGRIIEILNYRFVNQDAFKLSILSILLMVLVLFIAAIVSRYARRLLEKHILKGFHIDAGFQYTLLRLAHYLIIGAGLLYALKVGFSVDLTGIAVMIGFLSVGIGFGLQYISADTLSGFILLFERPIRVGDRLKVEEIEGRVQSIRIRSTTLITNDNITVIVPNSDLVRNKVINWSLSDKVRIRIPVGAAYGSDVDKVTMALIEAARNVKAVLDDPPPGVHFTGFGDSSLEFELLAWINQPHKHPQIRSQIRYQINRLFREQEIEIPFPQRDLHLRSGAIQMSQNGLEVIGEDLAKAVKDDRETVSKSSQ